MNLEELIDHFGFSIEEISIFNEEEFVEDVFNYEDIPQDWFKKEVKDWFYGSFLWVKI